MKIVGLASIFLPMAFGAAVDTSAIDTSLHSGKTTAQTDTSRVAMVSLSGISQKDVTAKDVNAKDVTAKDVSAKDVNAKDVSAEKFVAAESNIKDLVKPERNILDKKPKFFGGMCDPTQCGDWDCERFCFCFKMFPWFDTLFDQGGWSNQYCPSDDDTCECTSIEAWDLPISIDELQRDPFQPIDELGPIWNPPNLWFDVIKPRIICGDWLPGPEDLNDIMESVSGQATTMKQLLKGSLATSDIGAIGPSNSRVISTEIIFFLENLRETKNVKSAVDGTKTLVHYLSTHEGVSHHFEDSMAPMMSCSIEGDLKGRS